MDPDALWHGRGATLAHVIMVVFALVSVMGFIAYAFKGIGKFAAGVAAVALSAITYAASFNDENIYAMILMGLTSSTPSRAA